MSKVKVGIYEEKEVTKLNAKLFNEGVSIMLANRHHYHIGWSGLSEFVNWLEENYELTPKDKS